MFTDILKKRKKSPKDSMQKPSPAVEDPASGLNRIEPFPFPTELGMDMNAGKTLESKGLELRAFAKEYGIEPNEVWDLIEAGQLNCKSQDGKLIVFRTDSQSAMSVPKPESLVTSPMAPTKPTHVSTDTPCSAEKLAAELPPLPDLEKPDPLVKKGTPPVAEIALIIDHLSLAREENKDLLRLTQDAIAKISALSESVIAGKEDMIRLRDEKIAWLNSQMNAKDREIEVLRQEMEDLQILAATINFKEKPKPLR